MSKAEERLRELEERAKNGDGDAQRRLGDFWNQQGNHSEAINQWGKAAENGDRVAKSRMYNHLKKKVDKEKKEIKKLHRQKSESQSKQGSESKRSEKSLWDIIYGCARGA